MRTIHKILAAGALLLALVTSFAGCGAEEQEALLPLEEAASSYTLEQARKDGCVVIEDLRVTSGQEEWARFLQAIDAGEPASVRLVNTYTHEDKPMNLYVFDLSFDGKDYTYRYFSEGDEHKNTYPYLMRFEETLSEVGLRHILYLLTDNKTLSYAEIVNFDYDENIHLMEEMLGNWEYVYEHFYDYSS